MIQEICINETSAVVVDSGGRFPASRAFWVVLHRRATEREKKVEPTQIQCSEDRRHSFFLASDTWIALPYYKRRREALQGVRSAQRNFLYLGGNQCSCSRRRKNAAQQRCRSSAFSDAYGINREFTSNSSDSIWNTTTKLLSH